MEITMFIIFVLCDLLIVPICWFSFGKTMGEYKEGMVLGVHIPPECVHHPDVSSLSGKTQKSWAIFQKINFAASILICFLCFWDFLIFLGVWLIWIVEYVAGLYYLIIIPHRKMYRLKLENGWVDYSRKMIRIDTSVSAVSEKLALSWKWHLPILFLTAATAFLVSAAEQKYDMFPSEMTLLWTLYGSGVGVCLMFLALHIGIMRIANRVYSENSEINLAANRVTKRGWTEGLTYASWINGAAWILLSICYYFIGPDIPVWLYGGYTILITGAAAALLISIGVSVGKRRKILESNREPYYTDDDEYWKYGWYNNPDDRHILVQDRFNSMNYAFNYGRPGVKVGVGILWGVLGVITIGVIIWVCLLMDSFDKAEVIFTENHGIFSFEAAGYDSEFNIDEIVSVSLIDELPDEDYIRTNGGSTDKVNIGHFRGKETGKCMMFLFKGYTPILKIQLDNLTIYANSKDPTETESWYETMTNY